jgi:diguanylate cyclase (GGDEF)-like protein/PAS domain S-box-containing protein
VSGEQSDVIDISVLSRLTFERSIDAVLWVCADGRIFFANEAACQSLGYTVEELRERYVDDINPGFDYAQYWQQILDVRMMRFETTHQHRDGTRFPVEIITNCVEYAGQNYSCAFIRDISERKATEKEFQLTLEAVERSTSWFFRINSKGQLVYVNEPGCRALGYTREELIGQFIWAFDPNHTPATWQSFWDVAKHDGVASIETSYRRRDGFVYPVEVVINYIKNDEDEYCFCFAQDISERRNAAQKIERLAYFDALTGLPNRILFKDRLDSLIALAKRSGQAFSLLYVDLDRFKNVNDSLGHQVGDKLLYHIAQRFLGTVREADTVCRLGGDEFVLILPATTSEEAALVAEKILSQMSQSVQIDHRSLTIQASIGISCFPEHGNDAQKLIKYADLALYKAKQEGRNHYQFYAPGMEERSYNAYHLEVDLRGAVERNELYLVYQPQVELSSGRVCGIEALLRWKHPEKGFVSPADFIPLAEETGLIVSIGKWVIEQACMQLATWRQQGAGHFSMAVNISSRQLHDQDLGHYVYSVLERTGLKATDLELEVTESVMTDGVRAVALLEDMRRSGVKIAIDDFGTGYSSLSYLKRLPVTKLKIDQSFVRDIVSDENDAVLTHSIIALAHHFKLKAIAEGVETEEQLAFLRKHGCDEVQGYYVSRPLAADHVLGFTGLRSEERSSP